MVGWSLTKHAALVTKLYDSGNMIGPELTGSNRKDLKYLLENILDPSAACRQGLPNHGDRR